MRRVLVVDDNADAAESLAELLRLDGHEVHVATDGKQGLALAAEHAPDLILLDLGMPGVNGYEVALALRADPLLAHTRLVALTGRGSEADRRRTREADFDLHLTKPVQLAGLEEALALAPRAGVRTAGPRGPDGPGLR